PYPVWVWCLRVRVRFRKIVPAIYPWQTLKGAIGECADDTHVWRSHPKQREQIGECADDTHFWRLRPKQREQIDECGDDTLFGRWRPKQREQVGDWGE